MDVDVIVVGAGQGGVPLATRLAAIGKRVLLVERSRVGGTCVNYGCTPTKTMIASAQAAHDARRAASLGVHVGEVRVDPGEVVDRKDRIVREWREGVERRIREAGERLTFVHGHARFVGERELEVDGERHRAETVVLDVGTRAAVPPVSGLDGVPWLDNARALELREVPGHLLVLGGGYVGCELGQMYRRFGARVTVVGRSGHLLDREDPEISEALEAAFREEGIELDLAAGAKEVRSEEGGIVLGLGDGRELRGTHLLVAAGRKPNTDDLGCDAAGIRLDDRGYVRVDDRFRTSAEGVYALGDVTGGPQFTHRSWDDGRILFDLLSGRADRSDAGRLVPYTVFTDPQVARVGLSEREAKERGQAYEVARLPFEAIARARETGRCAGMLKVLLDPADERVLGAALVGAEAGELLHVFVALMSAGAPARALVDAEFVHPTFAEGVQNLLLQLDRYSLD